MYLGIFDTMCENNDGRWPYLLISLIFRCYPAPSHHVSRTKMPLEALQPISPTPLAFLDPFFPQPKMFKLQTPSKLSCFYANALSPPPAITFRKIWNQSILIIFVLSHIWYSSKCPTIYCEKDIVIYWEFVEDGFTTSSGPIKMTNFYFSWWK